MSDSPRNELERAAKEAGGGLVRELLELLRENKKWFLLPLLLAMLLMGLLVVLSGTPVAPFIYTIF